MHGWFIYTTYFVVVLSVPRFFFFFFFFFDFFFFLLVCVLGVVVPRFEICKWILVVRIYVRSYSCSDGSVVVADNSSLEASCKRWCQLTSKKLQH